MNLRHSTAAAAVAALVTFIAAPAAAFGPDDFEPIDGSSYSDLSDSWTEPLKAPAGYTQTKVFDEETFNIYPGDTDDLSDMNTENENGAQAGRYLYTTKEVGENGAVSVHDLKTGTTSVLAQDPSWRRLDGIRWTPWGTLLFAEETAGGRLFEAYFAENDPTTVTKIVERPQVGILRHEGIEALDDGTTFVIDELNGGSIYKFVPSNGTDLSAGQLYALKLTDLSDDEQLWNKDTVADKTGSFEWVALDMDQVVVDADAAANAVHATEFGRPEDVEVIDDVLYVNNTSEDRTVAIDLDTNLLTSYVFAGQNAPVEDKAAGVTGFDSPDNLAQGSDGKLWIVEDNTPSDIWATDDSNGDGIADEVKHFASLKDSGAEVSGIYFGAEPDTMYFSVQHPDKALADGVWKITKDAEPEPEPEPSTQLTWQEILYWLIVWLFRQFGFSWS